MSRPIQTFKHKQINIDDGDYSWHLVDDGNGIFVQYGVSYEEFDSGPGPFTTAIVEMPDGTVKNIPVENIMFLDVDQQLKP